MAEPLKVDDKNFKDVVIEAKVPFLVDFWAPWCAPCRAIAPTVEELAGEYAGRVGFAKVNVDDNPRVAKEYVVQSIPTLLVFKGGNLVRKIVGLTPKAELKKQLDDVLAGKG